MNHEFQDRSRGGAAGHDSVSRRCYTRSDIVAAVDVEEVVLAALDTLAGFEDPEMGL